MNALQADGGIAVTKALEYIKAGSPDRAMKLLEPMLCTPETQNLLQQLGKKLG